MIKLALVGKNISYSKSPLIYQVISEITNIELEYRLYDVTDLGKVDLSKLDGYNITTPFKQDASLNLNLDQTSKAIGAVNCVFKQHGYNTDIVGFEHLVSKINTTTINKVLILGNSASSNMIKYFFKDKYVDICSRTKTDITVTKAEIKETKYDLCINTTPLGQGTFSDTSPCIDLDITNFASIIDLNYTPFFSPLKCECIKKQVDFVSGFEMLIYQAVANFEIWTDYKLTKKQITLVKNQMLLQEEKKTLVIGMPLSGKTNLYKKLTGFPVKCIDLDAEIEKNSKLTITEIFAQNGEQYFRKLEEEQLKIALKSDVKYIFCGGYTLQSLPDLNILRDCNVCYLECSLKELLARYDITSNSRPLLKSKNDLIKLYHLRKLSYQKLANIRIKNEEINDYKWT